jgi:hypothetical protein
MLKVYRINSYSFPNSINRLMFVAEPYYISCEVRTEFVYVIQKKSSI